MSQTVNLHVDMGDGIPTHSLIGAPQKMTHDAGFRRCRCGWKPHLPYGVRLRFTPRPMGTKYGDADLRPLQEQADYVHVRFP